MKKQARISAEPHSSKYFALKVLDVYKIATKDMNPDKSFLGKIKNVVKRGFYEK